MDQFRIIGIENKFYVERYLGHYDFTEWTRITPYYKTKDKCQQLINGLNPKKLSTDFARARMSFCSP